MIKKQGLYIGIGVEERERHRHGSTGSRSSMISHPCLNKARTKEKERTTTGGDMTSEVTELVNEMPCALYNIVKKK